MPRFSDVVIAPGFVGAMMSTGFGVTFYVSNTTNPGEDQGAAGVTSRQQGRTPKNPFTTIAAAIAESVSGRGDVIVIQRGTYTENLTVNKTGLTLMGAVSFGYPDHVIISGRTVVTSPGCSFYNLEFFSNDATLASVRLGAFADAANTISSTWFENCSFASDGTTEPEVGCLIYGGNNTVFKRCWFVDNTFGINIRANLGEFAAHVVIDDCEFVESTTAHIGTAAGQITGGADAGIRNFLCVNSHFNRGEVTPTDYMNIAGTSSGMIAKCTFANATNAIGDIVIPDGILYVANSTEAGDTTARPA